VPVQLYTSGDEAELFLNGRSLGRKRKAPFQYRLRWDDVIYAPGEIKVVAYKNGRYWATDRRETTGPASRLVIRADRNRLDDSGSDLSFLTVSVVDQAGRIVPDAAQSVRFAVDGPGRLVGVDNGDSTSLESFQGPAHRAFHGLALGIVEAGRDATGTITVTVSADGLAGATTTLACDAPPRS